jgi:hypothetical protein
MVLVVTLFSKETIQMLILARQPLLTPLSPQEVLGVLHTPQLLPSPKIFITTIIPLWRR